MAYRGDDLDLRTPQSWSSAGREAGAGEQPNWWTRTAIYKGGRADPIWVDDNVMACCNHAYDLAQAHRAPEVRLEHLINALTLNEQASQVLEARGLSVVSLRRESGASIANDIPAAAGSVAAAPKRSEGVEEVLRLAADYAYPRRTPVTVDDILQVLFAMKRDLPGVQLLHRHDTMRNGRNGPEPRGDLRLDPLPHLSRPQQPAPWQQRYSAQPSVQDYFQPALPPREPMRQPHRDVAPASNVDSFQDNRLDSLERAVRDLGVDLADDRKTIRSLVTDLQRTSAVQADDSGRFRGGLNDRLAQIEETVIRSRNESAALPSAVIDRIGMIERTIDARLSEVGRPSGPSPALLDRLGMIERGIESSLGEMGRLADAMNDRMQALESAAQRPVEAVLSPLASQRLETITSFGGKVEALERTFQLILDRMTGIERKLADVNPVVDLSGIETRLQGLDRSVQATVEQSLDMGPVTELLSGIEERVAGLERTLDNRTSETGRTVSFIGERLRGFEETLGGHKTSTLDKLGELQGNLSSYADSAAASVSGHENDLSEVHEALLKLNANQQTLAGTLDQWRLDNTGDLSVINNRLKAIEDSEQRRQPQVDSLASQVGTIHSTLAKREVRKHRFLHWLFGTDEWYSASYDTRRWRARQGDAVPVQQRSTPPAPPPGMMRR